MIPLRLSTLAILLAGSLSLSPLLTSCRMLQHLPAQAKRGEQEQRHALRAELSPHLDVLGARNWIVIADPAHPILAGEGIDAVTVDAGTTDTLREVLHLLQADGSVTPRLWTCTELDAVTERQAPGIKRFRKEINRLTRKHLRYEMTDRIISMQLMQAAQTYRILYIKTTTPLPYSSIAIELDSGYWDSDAETELRERMQQQETPTTTQPAQAEWSSNASPEA